MHTIELKDLYQAPRRAYWPVGPYLLACGSGGRSGTKTVNGKEPMNAWVPGTVCSGGGYVSAVIQPGGVGIVIQRHIRPFMGNPGAQPRVVTWL